MKEEELLQPTAVITPTPHTMFFGNAIYEEKVAATEARAQQQLAEVNEAARSPEVEDAMAAAKQLKIQELAAEKRETLRQPAPTSTPGPTKLDVLHQRETDLRSYLKGEVATIKTKAASYTKQEENVHKRMSERGARMEEFQECRRKVLEEKDRIKAILQLRDDEQDQDTLLKLETYELKVMNGYTRMNRDQIEDEMKMARIKEKKEALMKQEENYLQLHEEHKQLHHELQTMQQQLLQNQQKQPPAAPAEAAAVESKKMQAAMLHLEKLQEQQRKNG